MADELEIPTYSIHDMIAENMDRAIFTVAPDEQIRWSATYVLMPTPQGLVNTPLMVLTWPSGMVGKGDLIASSMADLRQFERLEPALAVVRELVDHLRTQRASLLKS